MAGWSIKAALVLLSMAVLMPSLRAGIAEYDDFLLQQAEEAKQAALKAYHPHPMNVTDHFNHHVYLYVSTFHSSRRFVFDRSNYRHCSLFLSAGL